jgi:hypothetical protein
MGNLDSTIEMLGFIDESVKVTNINHRNFEMTFSAILGEKLIAKNVLLTLMFFSLTACVSSVPSPIAEEKPLANVDGLESQIICTREKVTGSNRKQKVCRTKAQIERERQAAKELVRRAAVGSGVTQNRPQ